MNVFDFLNEIRRGMDLECDVTAGLRDDFLEIRIVWKSFQYRYVMPVRGIEIFKDVDLMLKYLQQHIIEDATTKFRVAEVGEE